VKEPFAAVVAEICGYSTMLIDAPDIGDDVALSTTVPVMEIA
jgi:hypothetical protein